MHPNEELIHRLYQAFQQQDAEGMISCYKEGASFSDPVFMLQNKKEIAGMWSMLCQRATDLDISYSDVKADGQSGQVLWEARYTFSRTNRRVVNRIHAQFSFQDGLIIAHTDSFDFWKWSRQALGFPGYVLGWSGLLQGKVQSQARKALNAFLWSESE